MTVKTSNPKVFEAGLNHETGEIYVMTKTPERAPRKNSCYLFLYADPYLSNLYACCKIEVQALHT